MAQMMPQWKTSSVIHRYHEGQPVLSAQDVPYNASCVFNAGVVKYQGKYIMTFRDDWGFEEEKGTFKSCVVGVALSDDGIHWNVRKKPFLTKESFHDPQVRRIYDPRITLLDGKCAICLAVDTNHGLRGAIVTTEDFEKFEIKTMTLPDNRNMVLFPEKIGGRYFRLERPMPMCCINRHFDVWTSASPDLRYWGDSKLLLTVENVPFATEKVGPAAPPVKTDKGWLTLFHAVQTDPARGKNGWEKTWKKCYTAGIMLLDAQDPSRIIGMSKSPVLTPETVWETEQGFRTNVIFPGGMILEDTGEVKIYYGASDTNECLATADVNDLISLCTEKP